MGIIFANTYGNLTMGDHEIEVYSIIRQGYAFASKYFENSWFKFLEDCKILLNVNLIKADHLLSILNQINNNIQFTMKKSQKILPFLDIMVNKSGTKISMDIYNKPTDLKQYVPFTSNHRQHCLINILLPPARRLCTVVENEN